MLYWPIFLTQYAALMQSKLKKKKTSTQSSNLSSGVWKMMRVMMFSLGSALSQQKKHDPSFPTSVSKMKAAD